MSNFTGTAGNDVFTGGVESDTFNMDQGGDDKVQGSNGFDTFNFGAAFGAGDRVDGGADADFLVLLGDYSGGLTITRKMLQNVEVVELTGAFDYDLTIENQVVAAASGLSFDASGLGASHSASVDASASKLGSIAFHDGAGDDRILGGQTGDTLDLDLGGDDFAAGGAGNDQFLLGAALNRDDKLNGGSGHDVVQLDGDYSAGVAFKGTTMTKIEELIMGGSHSYGLKLHDANLASGDVMLVSAGSIGLNSLTFDGGDELDGAFDVEGGQGNDVLTGSNANGAGDVLDGGIDGHDTLDGGRGDDQLFSGTLGDDTMIGGKGTDFIELGAGGHGSDIIVMTDVVESTGADRDTVAHFNTTADRFDLDFFVSGFDASVGGALSEATFDADLEAALGKPQLGRLHATLFTPDTGDLGGKFFLVVDANNRAGYQAGEDFVVQLTDFIGGFSNAIFI